ncbi:MAG: hypothetical protein K940chlam1_01024 [Candidatus Anoxychlamydiales bacterium]|nr:hypothetical protein [Candidatus Anoxychlamydiales bacterium]NGX36638.1 hypothetical protein [Candidatus Anoxychlamydiales bacterium]
MQLSNLKAGMRAKIEKILEKKEIKIKLASLGIGIDTIIMMVKNDFIGAIILAIKDNRIIIDRDLAKKIDVKVL